MRFYGALSMLPFLFQVSVSSAQDSVSATTAPDLATLPANRNYVAVVIGLSSYKDLPDEVELDFARSDAAVVAKQLREHANFNHVYLLADGEATRENVLQTLRTKVAQVVGPEDVFVLYFVGHGIGAQVGSPYLLIHDSTLEGAEQDALAIPNSLKIYRPGHPQEPPSLSPMQFTETNSMGFISTDLQPMSGLRCRRIR